MFEESAYYPTQEPGSRLRLLESVAVHANDAVLITEGWPFEEPGPKIVYANEAFTSMTGYSAEEVVGKTPRILQGPKTDRARLDEIRRSLSDWEPVKVEVVNYRKDGSEFWVELNISPVANEEGRITHWVSVQRETTERRQAEDLLRLRGRAISESTNAIVITDPNREDNPIVYVNPAFERDTGYGAEEVIGQNPRFLQGDDRDQPAVEDLRTAVREGRECRVVLRNYCKNGELFWNEVNIYPVRDDDGRLVNYVGVQNDITQRKWEERRQSTQHEVTRILAEARTVEDATSQILQTICESLEWEVGGFWDLDPGANGAHKADAAGAEVLRCVQTWNVPTIDVSEFFETTHQTTSSRGEGLPGRIWESGKPAWISDVWDADDFSRMPVAVKEGLHGGFGFPVLLEGKVLGVMDFFSREVRQPDGEMLEMMSAIGSQVGQFIQRKSFEEQLQHQALHDDLTDLPNRILFTDRLRHALERVKRRKKSVAVLFLDLDNFKYVNDTLGHDIGDRLLVSSAERLKECLRPEDTAARLGGDEFAVLLEEVEEPSEAERVAKRILHALSSPFDLEGHRQFTSASVGIVIKHGSDNSPGDLLRSADLAMYKAKAAGKDRYAIFDPETERRSIQRLELENDLRSALERDEFRVHYQPLVLLRTGQVVGMEALVRWEHPRRGLVTPCEFIPVAEEIGLIVDIGARVLREACRQVRRWQERYSYSPPLIVGVNLSVRQLQDADLVGSVERTLRETGLEPESLTLEVTESAFVDDAEDHIATLRRLRGLGIRLAIDDFGVGYSSLSYLRRLPAGLLKIDGSFVERVTEAAEDKVLLRGAIDIAHGLGLRVTAEGVETAEQAALLESLECDLAQGRYFSEPLAAEEAEEILARNMPLGDLAP